ncbi:MAG: hypothetical protein ACLFP4_01270 [Spirochaetales bacterium]
MQKVSFFLLALLVLVAPASLVAQEAGAESDEAAIDGTQPPGLSPEFGLGITLGAQSFPNPDYTPGGDQPKVITYQSLGLTPDLAIGKLGVGLDLTVNYRFTAGDGNEFEVRAEDWVPDSERNFLEVYLPKIRYIRWGLKGDPLYALFGSIDNGTLGNGFILGGYTNTQYLPVQRIFGLSLDVDGALFDFPYVGIETFVGNLAVFDLFGSRLFVRPLAGTEIPVVRNLQIGTTAVVDRLPFYYAEDDPEAPPLTAFTPSGVSTSDASVLVWGADLRLPIIANPFVTLATFGDVVVQNGNLGSMVGLGGRLARVVTYGAQLRFLGENFLPVYFDATYDLFRPLKYATYAGTPGFATDPYVGWFASTGLSVLDDQLVFNASLESPFETDPDNLLLQPHLRAQLSVSDELLGGFGVAATYDKRGIMSLNELMSPEDAVIGARVSYRIQNATITFVYDLQYDPFPAPGEDSWITTTKIESAITLF